ncbi:MAG: hypothetical protein KBF68_09440 [Nitrosomonas sp.]|nr:hypothetical protein [Nitrosomonas sp.]
MRKDFEYNPQTLMHLTTSLFPKETLINSANEMKHEAHGTQQPRHINMIGEERVPRNEVIRSYSQLISVSLRPALRRQKCSPSSR